MGFKRKEIGKGGEQAEVVENDPEEWKPCGSTGSPV